MKTVKFPYKPKTIQDIDLETINKFLTDNKESKIEFTDKQWKIVFQFFTPAENNLLVNGDHFLGTPPRVVIKELENKTQKSFRLRQRLLDIIRQGFLSHVSDEDNSWKVRHNMIVFEGQIEHKLFEFLNNLKIEDDE